MQLLEQHRHIVVNRKGLRHVRVTVADDVHAVFIRAVEYAVRAVLVAQERIKQTIADEAAHGVHRAGVAAFNAHLLKGCVHQVEVHRAVDDDALGACRNGQVVRLRRDFRHRQGREEAVCRRAVVLDGGGVARKADDRVRAVVQQRLNALHLGGEGFRVALQQRLRVRQEVVVINARGVGVEVEARVRLGHGAVQLRHVDFLLIGLLHRLAEQRDVGGNQRRVGELALEKQLVEQRVAGSHIGVRRLPAGADVGAEALRVVRVQHRQLHHAVVEVAALKRVNIRRGMLRGAQRANQVEVQVQPVDVLLRNRGGVQQEVRLPNAVNVRRHVNAADAACVGHVGVVIGADFFGQVIHRDRLKLRHKLGRIIHAAAGQRSGVRHKLVDFFGGHGGLGFRQLRRQIGFNCFLLPRRGNGRHGDDALIVLRQVLLGNFGVLAFRLVLLEVVHVRD